VAWRSEVKAGLLTARIVREGQGNIQDMNGNAARGTVECPRVKVRSGGRQARKRLPSLLWQILVSTRDDRISSILLRHWTTRAAGEKPYTPIQYSSGLSLCSMSKRIRLSRSAIKQAKRIVAHRSAKSSEVQAIEEMMAALCTGTTWDGVTRSPGS
jgi:hypothetical protein